MRAALAACLMSVPMLTTFAAAQTTLPAGYSAISTLDARQMGLEAIRQGRPDIAAEIAQAMIKADPADSFAHFMFATSMKHLKQNDVAERAAKKAYRHAKTPEQSYQSAYMVSDLAFRRGALTTAQWWLRKSAEAAPDAARKAKSVAQFRAVKSRNPWRVNLAFSVRPSDNVNNGSSGQYNIIDGLPFVGVLSEDAQAVKGVVADIAVKLGYRLKQSATGETTLGLDLSKRHVALSSAEKARLGAFAGFGSDRISVSLRQDWRPENSKHSFSIEGELGRQSYQSGSRYRFGGVTLGHQMPLAPTFLLASAIEVEQREKQAGRRGDRSFAIRSTLVHLRDNQDLITATALANHFDTDMAGRSSTTIGMQLGYTLAKPLGPVGLSATLGVQKSQYDGYTLAGIAVPGGRSDTSSYAEMQFQFDDLSYTGFSPVLRLRHQRTTSNVSRFEAKETSVVIGLASKF